MIIRKTTVGYVVQLWDTDKKKWILQDFIGTRESEWETTHGDSILELDAPDEYLPFHMEQPKYV